MGAKASARITFFARPMLKINNPLHTDSVRLPARVKSRSCGRIERARTSGPDAMYGKRATKIAWSKSELGPVKPRKIFRAAGGLGARGRAATRYMIWVSVKELTPS